MLQTLARPSRFNTPTLGLCWLVVLGLLLSVSGGFRWQVVHHPAITSSAPTTATPPVANNHPTSATQMPTGLYPALVQAQQTEESPAYAFRTPAERPSHWLATNPAHSLSLDFGPTDVTINGWGLHLTGATSTEPTVRDNRIEYGRGDGLTEWYINGSLGLEQGFTLNHAPVSGVGQDGWLTLPIAFYQARVAASSNEQSLNLTSETGENLGRYGQLYSYDAHQQSLESHLTPGADGHSALLRVNLTGATYPIVIDPFVQQSKLTADDGVAGDEFGSSVAISDDGSMALIGANQKTIGANAQQGAVYYFVRNGTSWVQQSRFTSDDGAANDSFGFPVSLSQDGKTALIGALNKKIGSNTRQGAAYIFTFSSGNWSQQTRLVDTNGATDDFFGSFSSISADGKTALIGAYGKKVGANEDQGAAFVFNYSAGSWSSPTQLTLTNGNAGDGFGRAAILSADGNTALIGAFSKKVGSNYGQGAAYILTRTAGSWGSPTELLASDGASSDYFGYSVSLSEDSNTALIGAYRKTINGNTAQGAAYVFTHDTNGWVQQSELKASDGTTNDGFGGWVILSKDATTALISAFSANSLQGAVYVFTYSTGNWSQQSKLIASDGVAYSDFGVRVALTGDNKTAILGTYYSTIPGGSNPTPGAAYVFQLLPPSTTDLTSTPNPSTYGDSVTFAATVTPITATGSVSFKFDSATPVTVSLPGGSNVATYVTSTLSVGQHPVVATYNGDANLALSTSAILTQTVTAGSPVSIVTISGGGQSATITTTFAAPLVAQVRDGGSNPVSGTNVTFAAPSSGASGTFAGGATTYTGQTDTSGRITSTLFTANGIVGSYNVAATVAGVAQPASFQLTNLATCDPLVVTNTADDGTTCGTLRVAVAAASTGPNKEITITLAAGSVISLTTGLTLTTDVAITTTATSGAGPTSPPPIILQGVGSNSGDGLTLADNNQLYGLWVRGFSGRQIIVPLGSHARLRWVKASKS